MHPGGLSSPTPMVPTRRSRGPWHAVPSRRSLGNLAWPRSVPGLVNVHVLVGTPVFLAAGPMVRSGRGQYQRLSSTQTPRDLYLRLQGGSWVFGDSAIMEMMQPVVRHSKATKPSREKTSLTHAHRCAVELGPATVDGSAMAMVTVIDHVMYDRRHWKLPRGFSELLGCIISTA